MEQKKILFIAQEISPYIEECPSTLFTRLLPQLVQEEGNDIRVFMPRYGIINERRHQLHEVIRLSGVNITVNDVDSQLLIKVASLPSTRLQIYFIDNKEYFSRKTQFGFEEKYGNDTAERAVFFLRGVFDAIKKLRWIPDLVHCTGWFASLVPIYLKTLYRDDPNAGGAKVVYSSFANEPTGEISEKLLEVLAFDHLEGDQLQALKGEISADAMRRLAAYHADGVVIPAGEEKSTTSLYAQELNKPHLTLGEDLKASVPDLISFYDRILQPS